MVKAKVISTSSKKALFSRTKEYYITLEFSIKNGKKIKKQILFDGKLPFEYYEKLQDFIYVCYDKNNPNTVIIPKRKFIVEKTGNNKRFIKYSDLKELLFSRNSTILSKLSKINKDWQEIVPEREWVNHRLNSKITKGANDTLQYFAVNSLITSILKELYNKSGNTNTAFNTKGNLEYKDSLLQVYSVVDFQDVKNIKLSLKIFKNK
ncbi:MAG TPA: hypothetical protein ENK91_03460 [Bacteroidetes bacterium]|nr:hypothetical protein [Bacteroidota bacterium]